MGSFWRLGELGSTSINLKPGLRLGHFQKVTMKYLDDILSTILVLFVLFNIVTCTPYDKKSCDITHPAGVPAHLRCENY
jgi:hypothetical protein